MNLKYKTNNNISPRGLNKIYLCAHPEEYNNFVSFCDNLIENDNCALWYKEDSSKVIELSELKSFDLIIINVTESFLLDDNIAKDVELKSIFEENLPILPLLDDEILLPEYTMLFKNKQYICKNEYNNRITEYLSSRFISNNLITNIINSFKATFFLSYRKKDRKFLNSIFNCIHDNEEFREISIWFDDYLDIGEDFEESIELALDKSLIFILAVTKNLVCEDNYVSNKEYPYAIENNKYILPILLEEVDNILLNSRFPNIPFVIDIANKNKIKALINKIIESNNIKLNDNINDYYFAIAYFYGIYVEKNPNIAIEFLTKCASKQNDDALRFLVEIFSEGLYTKTDYNKAIKYQSQLCKIYKYEFSNYLSYSTEKNYIESIVKLGDLYAKLNKKIYSLYNYYKAYKLMKYSTLWDDEVIKLSIKVEKLNYLSNIFTETDTYNSNKIYKYLEKYIYTLYKYKKVLNDYNNEFYINALIILLDRLDIVRLEVLFDYDEKKPSLSIKLLIEIFNSINKENLEYIINKNNKYKELITFINNSNLETSYTNEEIESLYYNKYFIKKYNDRFAQDIKAIFKFKKTFDKLINLKDLINNSNKIDINTLTIMANYIQYYSYKDYNCACSIKSIKEEYTDLFEDLLKYFIDLNFDIYDYYELEKLEKIYRKITQFISYFKLYNDKIKGKYISLLEVLCSTNVSYVTELCMFYLSNSIHYKYNNDIYNTDNNLTIDFDSESASKAYYLIKKINNDNDFNHLDILFNCTNLLGDHNNKISKIESLTYYNEALTICSKLIDMIYNEYNTSNIKSMINSLSNDGLKNDETINVIINILKSNPVRHINDINEKEILAEAYYKSISQMSHKYELYVEHLNRAVELNKELYKLNEKKYYINYYKSIFLSEEYNIRKFKNYKLSDEFMMIVSSLEKIPDKNRFYEINHMLWNAYYLIALNNKNNKKYKEAVTYVKKSKKTIFKYLKSNYIENTHMLLNYCNGIYFQIYKKQFKVFRMLYYFFIILIHSFINAMIKLFYEIPAMILTFIYSF